MVMRKMVKEEDEQRRRCFKLVCLNRYWCAGTGAGKCPNPIDYDLDQSDIPISHLDDDILCSFVPLLFLFLFDSPYSTPDFSM